MKETIYYLPQRNWEHTNYACETDTDVRVELSSYSTPSTAASTSSSPRTRLIRREALPQKEGDLLEEMTHFFLLLLTRRCFDAEKRKPKVAPGLCCSGFTQGDTKVGLTW